MMGNDKFADWELRMYMDERYVSLFLDAEEGIFTRYGLKYVVEVYDRKGAVGQWTPSNPIWANRPPNIEGTPQRYLSGFQYLEWDIPEAGY